MTKTSTKGLIALLVVFLAVTIAFSQRRHGGNAATQGQPGQFDYYLLTLSWSPEFCHSPSHAGKPECQSGHYGFVIHGLWPQFDQGGYPEQCSTAPGLSNPSEVADIMPDAGLVAHEWSTHGTCSGLDAEAYFKLLRQAFQSVKIPDALQSPHKTQMLPPQEIKTDFVQANPGWTADDMTVSCGNNYLTAVSLCMTKDLKPTACRALRDCRANVVKIPPVR